MYSGAFWAFSGLRTWQVVWVSMGGPKGKKTYISEHLITVTVTVNLYLNTVAMAAAMVGMVGCNGWLQWLVAIGCNGC